jgi:hypothetical protein
VSSSDDVTDDEARSGSSSPSTSTSPALVRLHKKRNKRSTSSSAGSRSGSGTGIDTRVISAEYEVGSDASGTVGSTTEHHQQAFVPAKLVRERSHSFDSPTTLRLILERGDDEDNDDDHDEIEGVIISSQRGIGSAFRKKSKSREGSGRSHSREAKSKEKDREKKKANKKKKKGSGSNTPTGFLMLPMLRAGSSSSPSSPVSAPNSPFPRGGSNKIDSPTIPPLSISKKSSLSSSSSDLGMADAFSARRCGSSPAAHPLSCAVCAWRRLSLTGHRRTRSADRSISFRVYRGIDIDEVKRDDNKFTLDDAHSPHRSRKLQGTHRFDRARERAAGGSARLMIVLVVTMTRGARVVEDAGDGVGRGRREPAACAAGGA